MNRINFEILLCRIAMYSSLIFYGLTKLIYDKNNYVLIVLFFISIPFLLYWKNKKRTELE